MQETDKILNRLAQTLSKIDLELKGVNGKEQDLKGFYEDLAGVKKDEKELENREIEIGEIGKKLEKENENLSTREKELILQNKVLEEECRWIEKEVKKQFCQEFVFEAIYNVEKIALEKEEAKLNHAKQVSIASYEKLQNSLSHFEKLNKHFKSEASMIIPDFASKKIESANKTTAKISQFSHNSLPGSRNSTPDSQTKPLSTHNKKSIIF